LSASEQTRNLHPPAGFRLEGAVLVQAGEKLLHFLHQPGDERLAIHCHDHAPLAAPNRGRYADTMTILPNWPRLSSNCWARAARRRQRRIDHRAQLAALDVVQEALQFQQAAHGGAEDRQTLEEYRSQVDLHQMPGGGAAEHDAAAALQRLDALREHLAPTWSITTSTPAAEDPRTRRGKSSRV
jgi:hypothetical protein